MTRMQVACFLGLSFCAGFFVAHIQTRSAQNLTDQCIDTGRTIEATLDKNNQSLKSSVDTMNRQNALIAQLLSEKRAAWGLLREANP
jgi:transcriptional antiterminator